MDSAAPTIRVVKRRTMLQAIPAAALLPVSVSAGQREKPDSSQGPAAFFDYASVMRLREVGDLEAHFRGYSIQIFDRHGMESVAYWTRAVPPSRQHRGKDGATGSKLSSLNRIGQPPHRTLYWLRGFRQAQQPATSP